MLLMDRLAMVLYHLMHYKVHCQKISKVHAMVTVARRFKHPPHLQYSVQTTVPSSL
jgi:hypothetical protein